MKPIKKQDVLRLLYPPQKGDKVRILIPISDYLSRSGVVLDTWEDPVTAAYIVKVKFNNGLVGNFFEDVIEVLNGSI